MRPCHDGGGGGGGGGGGDDDDDDARKVFTDLCIESCALNIVTVNAETALD